MAWHCSALDRHEAWAAGLEGDILRVGVHSLTVGDSLRVGGQESGPRRRRMPLAARKRTRPRGMSLMAPDARAWRRASPGREADAVSRRAALLRAAAVPLRQGLSDLLE